MDADHTGPTKENDSANEHARSDHITDRKRSPLRKLTTRLPAKLQQARFLVPLLFIIGFGAIGGYLVMTSRAATVVLVTVEAESLALPTGSSIIDDTAASASKAVQYTSNGTATGNVTLSAPATSLSVRARGSQCKGSPQMVVKVDGNTVQTSSVGASSWSEAYTATVNLSATSHNVSVSFTNDLSRGSKCSRDLYVDKISFFGTTTAAPTMSLTANPASVTAGATSTLTWNSTNATSCTASNGWSGTKATSGSEATAAINANTTYVLSCTGSGGTTSANATVTISTAAGTAGNMFISNAELMSKPMSGAGWTFLKSKADMSSYGTVTLSSNDTLTQSYVLAGALVYARDPVANAAYKEKVITYIKQVCGTEGSENLLRLSRALYGYVVSADLVKMPMSTTCNNGQTWQAFLQSIRTKVIPGHGRWQTLEFTSANTSSNWGAYALSSHLAVSYALNDTNAIQRDLNIFKRFLGDTGSPAAAFVPTSGYTYNNNGATWDMTPTLRRGINPASPADQRNGALIEDVLRYTSGADDSQPCCSVSAAAIGYQEETLDGILSTAQLFKAHGVDVLSLQDQALKRAFHYFITHGGPGPYTLTRYIPYAINYHYGTTYATQTEDRPFRHMGYGSWLFTK